jgi:hypothetical protein
MIGKKGGCEACRGEIFGAPVKLGSVSYHQKCFVCSVCRVRLQMTTYAMSKETLYCQTCYRNVVLRDVDTRAADGTAMGLTGTAGPTATAAATAPSTKPRYSDSSRDLERKYAQQPPPPPTTAAPAPPVPIQGRAFCHVCGCKVEVAAAQFCVSCGTRF